MKGTSDETTNFRRASTVPLKQAITRQYRIYRKARRVEQKILVRNLHKRNIVKIQKVLTIHELSIWQESGPVAAPNS
jgi:hypothetical protein